MYIACFIECSVTPREGTFDVAGTRKSLLVPMQTTYPDHIFIYSLKCSGRLNIMRQHDGQIQSMF